jgi:PAS domain S-box-containing protein
VSRNERAGTKRDPHGDLSGTLREQAEEILEKKTVRDRSGNEYADDRALIHELQVHQIELEMQNEELKRARLEAEELQEKYIDLYDFAPAGYFTVDKDGIITEVNLTGCRLLGSERQSTIGRRFQFFLHPDSIHAFNAFCRDALEIGGTKICEVELLREERERFFAQIEGSEISDKNPDKRQIRMAILDITARKEIEEALRASEKEYRTLFHTMLNGFAVHEIICDKEGKPVDYRFLDINPAFERMTGLSREKVIGRTVLQLMPNTEPEWIERYGKVALTGEPDYFEMFSSEIGKLFEVRVYQNTPQQFTSIFSDITERKQAEKALQQANNKLNLLSSITRHDILNQVSILLGYADLAGDEDLTPQMQEYISDMEQAAKTIQHQIEFTREYQEIGVKAAAWQNLGETVMNSASTFYRNNISLEISCDDFEIFADPLLQKVFYNLFDNAFRYAAPFTTITVHCQETGEGLLVVFADDGVGISEDDRKHLFERGFGRNTGLGLFLSREILSITGITITENGEPGKGARFEITVPINVYRLARITETH